MSHPCRFGDSVLDSLVSLELSEMNAFGFFGQILVFRTELAEGRHWEI